MEEPSWLHPHESPLPGDGTPTSALAAGSPPQRAPAAAGDLEASSRAAPGAALAEAGAAAAAGAAQRPAAAQQGGAAAASEYDQHPSAEHMVWTNDDGDIDALPWDMGGWSTGSSAERAAAGQQQEQQPPAGQPRQQGQVQGKLPADPVDEDALIGALRRKVRSLGLPPGLNTPGCLRTVGAQTLQFHVRGDELLANAKPRLTCASLRPAAGPARRACLHGAL